MEIKMMMICEFNCLPLHNVCIYIFFKKRTIIARRKKNAASVRLLSFSLENVLVFVSILISTFLCVHAMPDYGNPSYWDERYAARGPTEQFDWYQDFSRLKDLIVSNANNDVKNCEVLLPGCGNSPFPGHLYDHGFKNLTCIDVSTVVVQQQTERYKNFDTIEFLVGDCLNLDYIPDECFDLIIEKALGDAVLCGDNSFSNIARLNNEMYRVLKPGGVYLSVSHGVPQTRVTHLQSENRQWTVDYKAISKPLIVGFDEGNDASDSHFIYVCRKNDGK